MWKKAEQNPWHVSTLEWTHCDSPPIYHNFDIVPTVVRGAHEYADPAVMKKLGRDYLDQVEPGVGAADEGSSDAMPEPEAIGAE
jgi:heme/copper-type cytochrome/quinol oxidase subunit 1